MNSSRPGVGKGEEPAGVGGGSLWRLLATGLRSLDHCSTARVSWHEKSSSLRLTLTLTLTLTRHNTVIPTPERVESNLCLCAVGVQNKCSTFSVNLPTSADCLLVPSTILHGYSTILSSACPSTLLSVFSYQEERQSSAPPNKKAVSHSTAQHRVFCCSVGCFVCIQHSNRPNNQATKSPSPPQPRSCGRSTSRR